MEKSELIKSCDYLVGCIYKKLSSDFTSEEIEILKALRRVVDCCIDYCEE